MVDTQNQIRHHYHNQHHKIHNEWCHLGINNTQRGIWSLCHKIVLIIRINIINTMICFWPLAPWAMETLKVSWRFPHEGLTLTQTLRRLRIRFQLLWSFCWFRCRCLGWRRWWWNLWLCIKVDLWKKLFYERKQKPQNLWTELEADQGSGKYYHCLIISMIVVMLVVFEKVSTKPLEWGEHVAIFYDDGYDDSHLPSTPKVSPPTFAARCSHIGRQTSRGSLWLGCYSVGYRLIGIKFWKIFIVGHPLNHLL